MCCFFAFDNILQAYLTQTSTIRYLLKFDFEIKLKFIHENQPVLSNSMIM